MTQQQWWTDVPLVFTQDDYEGNRIRFLIAEKRVRCETRIVDRFNLAPGFLTTVNIDNAYPVLVDKHLICHGSALDELFHERYPAPAVLPIEPIRRAQVRMLEQRVRSWYGLDATDLSARMLEVVGAYDGQLEWFGSHMITVIDIALAPILHQMPVAMIDEIYNTPFFGYRERLLTRPSFQASLQSQAAVMDMEVTDDGDADDELLEEISE